MGAQYKRNRLVLARSSTPFTGVAMGYRLQDVELMSESLSPHLCCPRCSKKGVLTLSAAHEARAGLASTLRWWCSSCTDTTLEQPTSRALPRAPEQKGPKRFS